MFRSDHLAINVSSLERSRKFYTMLGGEVISAPSERFMEIKLGTVTLHLLPLGGPKNDTPQGIHHAAFKVESLQDLETICSQLNNYQDIQPFGPFRIQDSPPLGEGHHLERMPPQKTLYFRDPDGIQFEVRCYR